MAALTIFIFSLLVSTTFATEDLEKAQVVEKEERPAFQALPLQLGAATKEFYFHMYYRENFGEIGITDVLLWDDLSEEKLVARMQGPIFQSDGTTYGWHMNCSIEFKLPEYVLHPRDSRVFIIYIFYFVDFRALKSEPFHLKFASS